MEPASCPPRRLRCSTISLDLGEEMVATAPEAGGYLLVEQPAPWGATAATESRLDPGIGRILAARAAAAGMRFLLVARPGGPEDSPRSVFLVSASRSAPRTRRLRFHDPAELLDLDLAGFMAGGGPVAGEQVAGPLYLVCTNGRRDACCALYGRALVAELHATLGESLWECSHLGGHRFAPNLVRLPEGLYFGRLRPGDGSRLVGALEQGGLTGELLRGRSVDPPAVQAAEAFLRRALETWSIDAVTPGSAVGGGRGEWSVSLECAGRRYAVLVRGVPDEPPRATSCRADELETPLRWDLLEIRP